MTSTFAQFVTTFTIPKWAIRKTALSREHRLKTFLKIGFARYVESEKKNLRKRLKTLSFLLHHYLLLLHLPHNRPAFRTLR